MSVVQIVKDSYPNCRRTTMHTINGHIDNNAVVVNENISLYDGCDVLITILDGAKKSAESVITSGDERKEAARSIAGLWKLHDNTMNVNDEVRSMRKGRNFDF